MNSSSSSLVDMASCNEPPSSLAAMASSNEPSSLSAATSSSNEPPSSSTVVSTELVVDMEPADWESLKECLRFTSKDITEFKWPSTSEAKKKEKKLKRIPKNQKKRTTKGKRRKEDKNKAEKDNRNYGKKLESDDNEPLLSKDITETDEEYKDRKDDAEAQGDVSETLVELLGLRKLRRPPSIDAQKLSKGDNKGKKKVRKAVNDLWKLKTGGIVNIDDVRTAERENEKGAENGLKLDIFTKQTNTLDVDKQMVTYIETELKRRRGQSVEPEEEEAEFKDIYDAFYQCPEHLKVEPKPVAEGNVQGEAKPVAEGNVQWYTQMLTAIPEVDLGIDVQLKNIEETEKGKRKMIEDQQKKKKDVVGRKGKQKVIEDQQKKKDVEQFAGSNYVATDRLYQGRKVQSDHEYRKAPNPHAPPGAEGSGSGAEGSGSGRCRDRRNLATDDIVPERFKKRIRR